MYHPPLARIALACCFGLAFTLAWSEPRGETSLEETLSEIRSLGELRENTEGERRFFAFLVSEANRLELPVSSISIIDYSDRHSFSQVLQVQIPGTGNGSLVLAIPVLSEAPWGDNEYSLAAAVGLMERLAKTPPRIGVVLAFLGADEDLLGSKAYAAYCADQGNLAVLRVEMGGTPESQAELLFGGRGQLAPYWFVDRGITAVRNEGYRELVRANRSILYRLGLMEGETALDPWFQKGLPALTVRVQGSATPMAGPGEKDLESCIRLLESFVFSFAEGVPDQWDRQYVLFEVAGVRIAVRETQYIAMVLGVCAALGFFFSQESLRKKDAIKEKVRKIPHGFVALAAVFLALFLCVVVCGLGFRGVLRWAGSPSYWRLHPVAFFALQMVQLLTLFISAASVLARFGIIPRKAEFFRESPLVVLGIDVLLFSALGVSLSFLFLWAFIATMIGHRVARAVKRTWPEAVSLAVSLVPLAFVGLELARSPELFAFRSLLIPGPRGIAYQCFLGLPFLLMVVALGEGVFGEKFYSFRTAAVGCVAFLAVFLAGTAWFVADARGFKGPEDVRIRETVDETEGTRRFEVEGARPLQAETLSRPGLSLAIEKGASSWKGNASAAERMLRITTAQRSFLDRTLITLSISARENPLRIRVEIPEIASGSIYDCSYPFKASPNGRGISISVGARPPQPLDVALTVSRDFAGPAQVTAEFDKAPEPFEAGERLRIADHSAEYTYEIPLSARTAPVF